VKPRWPEGGPGGPDGRGGEPKSLGTSLDAVTRRLGLEDPKGLGRLFARWPEIVGTAMAAHVKPIRLDGDALVVTVDHPAWATQVRRLGGDLLDRVVEETGASRPTRLEVRVRR
jgi:predicted nucleic acid-binding Zn ribbon protein